MTRSPWRFAASAGLLAAVLMTNGGAIAVAEPAPGDASSSTGGAATPKPGSSYQGNPLGDVASSIRSSLQNAADALTAGRLAHLPALAGSSGSSSGVSMPNVPQMLAAGLRPYAPVTGFSGPKVIPPAVPAQDPTPPADVTPPTATPAADVTPGSPATTNTAPAPTNKTYDPVAPLAGALNGTANQVGLAAQAIVTPAAAAVAAGLQNLATPLAQVQGAIAPAVTHVATSLTAPIPDVITALQAVLTSTTDAFVPVTQIPADLAAMFAAAGLPTGAGTVTGQVGGTADRSAPALPWTRPMVVPPRAATPGQAAAVGTTAIEPVRGTAIPLSGRTNAIAHASALNANARVAPTDIVSEELQKFFNSYGALIITASLSALVAAALPGIAAFLLPTLAGMGFGYRQARAGLKVRASGIARFAGSGPVGIVRSGSQISLRSGAQRVPRPARAESGRRSERDSHFAA